MPRAAEQGDEYWVRLAEAEVRATLKAMPADLRSRLTDVPVVFEARPGRRLLKEGWTDDLLGLFEGPAYGERGTTDVSITPPIITLFLENLRDEAEDRPAAFRQEVRTTLLHEIGHYLGLDEDDLVARNLECARRSRRAHAQPSADVVRHRLRGGAAFDGPADGEGAAVHRARLETEEAPVVLLAALLRLDRDNLAPVQAARAGQPEHAAGNVHAVRRDLEAAPVEPCDQHAPQDAEIGQAEHDGE